MTYLLARAKAILFWIALFILASQLVLGIQMLSGSYGAMNLPFGAVLTAIAGALNAAALPFAGAAILHAIEYKSGAAE